MERSSCLKRAAILCFTTTCQRERKGSHTSSARVVPHARVWPLPEACGENSWRFRFFPPGSNMQQGRNLHLSGCVRSCSTTRHLKQQLENGLDPAVADDHAAVDQPHSARNRCTEPTRLDSGAGKVENCWDVAGLDKSVAPSSHPP